MEGDNSTPWVDRAWMQNVLRDVENNPSLSITDYQVKDASSKGDHYLSDMLRIYVKLQREGKAESKMNFILKKLPGGKVMQKTLSESSAFPNEIKVLSQVIPKYQNILEAAAPGRFRPFAARHIYSQSTLPYFLIVTDLAPEGFKMAERRQGLNLEHSLLVMRTLGRFHAASVALHDSEPQLIESFKENFFIEDSSKDIIESFSCSSITSLAKLVRSWPDGGSELADRLLTVADSFRQKFKQQLSPEGSLLNVLVHGDLWVNNLLFKYNDVDGSVEDMRMVDFQQGCYASCAIDLQHFISSSPKDEVRAAHTEDLLREYHTELCSTLELLGQTRHIMTFQDLVGEYERKGVYGFLISLIELPHILADSENVSDVEGMLSGVDQTETSDKRVANREYLKVIKRLLPIFQQNGYL